MSDDTQSPSSLAADIICDAKASELLDSHLEDNHVLDIPVDKDTLIAQLCAELRESRRRYNIAVDAWQALQEECQQLRIKIDKMTINYTGMKGREKRWHAEEKLLRNRLRHAEASLDKMTTNFLGMKGREKRWHAEEKLLRNRLRHAEASLDKMTTNFLGMKEREKRWLARENSTKNTISFQLGASILNAGKSWRGFWALPGELLRLSKEAHKRRATQQRQQKEVAPQTPSKTVRSWDFKPPAGDKLRVAAIMDEFTCRCYAPECELLELLPDTWQQQMEEFRPDVLFVESAWQGKDEAWKQKLSGFSETIQQLLAWCRKTGIPSLLWNKEDPGHYSTFLPLAKAVDVVFTTDIDCIPLYKRDLGHNHVYLLPFAAQPVMHNPVEKYDRQHKFCFAGSYYLRYPERQRDFAMLIKEKKKHAGIDIYDRNFDNKHPHYTFPDVYRPYILGKLPYEEIDRAYKGYDFGINMNTGKQSQSMFARRVYEMAASNTIVVSNFSRGMRNFFGDLVISGDDRREIERRLLPVLQDKTLYRKLRLRALRHVLAQHTYRRRLEYIREKLWNQPTTSEPLVCLIAPAANATDASLLLEHFRRQNYARKELWLVGPATNTAYETSSDIHVVPDLAACRDALATAKADFLGLLRPEHWYGPSYLTDLILTTEYCSANIFGKAARYVASDDTVCLRRDGQQYRNADKLPLWASICRTSSRDLFWDALEAGQREFVGNCFAIDEFNFIEQGAGLAPSLRDVAEDLVLADTGIDFIGRLLPLSEKLTLGTLPQVYPDADTKELSAQALAKMFKNSDSLRFTEAGSALHISSNLPVGQHDYCHGAIMKREQLNLLLNSTVSSAATGSLNLCLCFTFLDAAKQKLSHNMARPGKLILAIPQECRFVRISLRVEGPGTAQLQPLRFGKTPFPPATLLCRSSTLILAKQYPAYDDLYKYGFLHSRLAAYRKAERVVDMFRIRNTNAFYSEFEGIDVATGDARLLDATLASGQISHVCVHLLDRGMWNVLKKHLDHVRVTIWIHGAEIQHWKRREFEFMSMPAEEIEKKKKRTLYALQLWKEILTLRHENIKFVFVSDTLRQEAEEDLEMNFTPDSYTVIHNFIDNEVFPYLEKKPDERFRILSIRPYSALTYANDLSVAAIEKLSQRPDFERYSFTLAGDGPLFENTVAPVAHFPNVHLEQRFLTHAEMQEQFCQNGIFLVPTRSDTQGVSRDEAMSAGLVPVTNAVSAIPEFVDETCACLAPAEDSTALADGIEKLANDPDLFLAMSQRAAAQVRRLSGFEQTIGRELQLLENPATPLASAEEHIAQDD